MRKSPDKTISASLRHYVQLLVKALETHDPGCSANAYFCVCEDGSVLADVGANGFEACTGENEARASYGFRVACAAAGGAVKGGCIPE